MEADRKDVLESLLPHVSLTRRRGTLVRRANVNEEYVGGSVIIVATRTKMAHVTLGALFRE